MQAHLPRMFVAWALLFAITACGGSHTHPTSVPDASVPAPDGGEPVPDAGTECPSGQRACDGGCVDVESDRSNCGSCGNTCMTGLVCLGGACVCPPPTIMCNGSCLDPTADDENCGQCGNKCTGATHCVASTCKASNIQHVVLIVQENHTFDAYFGNYCQAPAGSNPTCTDGPDCCEAAPPTDPTGTLPTELTDDLNTSADPNHSQACELEEIDNGAMDQYTTGSDIGSSTCNSACSRPGNFAVAGSDTVGTYWQLAASSALADRYFQPIVGSTSSNDMYFAIAHEQFIDNQVAPDSIGSECSDPTHICVGGTKTLYAGRPTIADLLLTASRTFAVYADGYAEAAAAGYGSCPSVPSECPYSEFLHPIDARSCLYDPSDIPFEYYDQLTDSPSLMKDYNDLATDVAQGVLPNFAYVKARTFRNEHPSYSKISDGEAFVSQTIETIMSSPYKDNTLILLTWDEGGGFFDHVSPPPSTDFDDQGNPVPHGTRVPFLAIGPFARQGQISHVVMDHASIVRFLEYNFIGKVGLLGYSDAQVNNIGSMLDQSRTGIPIPEQQ